MRRAWLLLFLLLALSCRASSPGVYQKAVQTPLGDIYQAVQAALKAEHFRVVSEVSIGESPRTTDAGADQAARGGGP